MIVEIRMLEAENARVDARQLSSAGCPSAEPSLVSLFHHASASEAFEDKTAADVVVLPANVVVMAVISARQKLTPLRNALTGEGARLDHICKATAFRVANETWVRLTQADAQMIKACWGPSLSGYEMIGRIH